MAAVSTAAATVASWSGSTLETMPNDAASVAPKFLAAHPRQSSSSERMPMSVLIAAQSATRMSFEDILLRSI